MDEKRVRVIAVGLVQGVFFRASLRDEARRLGLSGWVRNRSDGRVEAELQGRPEAVEAGVEFIRRGPGHAEIAELEVAALRPVSGEEGFGAAPDA